MEFMLSIVVHLSEAVRHRHLDSLLDVAASVFDTVVVSLHLTEQMAGLRGSWADGKNCQRSALRESVHGRRRELRRLRRIFRTHPRSRRIGVRQRPPQDVPDPALSVRTIARSSW